jgi:peptidoglycan glycosyltransferase
VNLRIRRLGVVLSVLYLVLFLQLNRIQFFGAERLQDDVNNTRGLIREFGRERGPIITADGVLVARSVEYDGSVDFRSRVPGGRALRTHHRLSVAQCRWTVGLERSYNDELAAI